MLKMHIAALAFVCALSVAGVYGESQESKKKSPAPPKIGAPAPDFVLKDQKGKDWKLSAQRKKTVVISFGSISCFCGRAALKELQGIQEKYASRGLLVVHVNTEPWLCEADPTYLPAFAKENKITYPLLVDRGLAASSRYPSDTAPFLCLVDTKGVLRFTLAGHPEDYAKKVTAQVEKYLPPPPKSKADGRKPDQEDRPKS